MKVTILNEAEIRACVGVDAEALRGGRRRLHPAQPKGKP